MATITAEVVETGEKRDTRGRRVVPLERRMQMVRRYRESGLTMAEFARREKVKYATFAGWVARAQRSGLAKEPIKFAEMTLPLLPPGPTGEQLEVRLLDGTVVRGHRVAELVTLVRALRA